MPISIAKSAPYITDTEHKAGPSWFNLTALMGTRSSAVTSSNGYGAIHYSVATIAAAEGLTLMSNSPLAALRLNSTALSGATIAAYLLSGEGW